MHIRDDHPWCPHKPSRLQPNEWMKYHSLNPGKTSNTIRKCIQFCRRAGTRRPANDYANPAFNADVPILDRVRESSRAFEASLTPDEMKNILHEHPLQFQNRWKGPWGFYDFSKSFEATVLHEVSAPSPSCFSYQVDELTQLSHGYWGFGTIDVDDPPYNLPYYGFRLLALERPYETVDKAETYTYFVMWASYLAGRWLNTEWTPQ